MLCDHARSDKSSSAYDGVTHAGKFATRGYCGSRKPASGRYRIDPDLVNSVIRAESGFKVHAVSPKGAQGLMQLMPGTASKLGCPTPSIRKRMWTAALAICANCSSAITSIS